MRHFKLACAVSCAVVAVGALETTPAEAAIVCNGQYQIINGSPHATPWCEDNYLARVARSYGLRVSNRAVRQNPNLKERVCRTVGHDSRVSNICAGLRGEGSRRRWP